jgi:hypothetical protein
MQRMQHWAHIPLSVRTDPFFPKNRGEVLEGGEVLEVMFAQGRTSIEESKTSRWAGMEGGQFSAARVRSGPAGIVSNDARTVPTRLLYFGK